MKLNVVTLRLPIEPFWSLALFAGTDCTGLADLEQAIVAELGIKADFEVGSGIYASREDAERVAKEFQRRRPDVPVFISGSEDYEM